MKTDKKIILGAATWLQASRPMSQSGKFFPGMPGRDGDCGRTATMLGKMMKIGGGLTQNAVVLGKPSKLELKQVKAEEILALQ